MSGFTGKRILLDDQMPESLKRDVQEMFAAAEGDPVELTILDYMFNEESTVDKQSFLEAISRLPDIGELIAQLEAEAGMESVDQPVPDEPVIVVQNRGSK